MSSDANLRATLAGRVTVGRLLDLRIERRQLHRITNIGWATEVAQRAALVAAALYRPCAATRRIDFTPLAVAPVAGWKGESR